MAELKTKETTRSREHASYNETTYAQYKDIQRRVDNVEKELDCGNIRLDRVERKLEKLDEKIDKVADKIDELRKEIKSSSNHGQISNITTIGIALAVIYSILK